MTFVSLLACKSVLRRSATAIAMATSCVGADAALPPSALKSSAAGVGGASLAADKVAMSDLSMPTFAGLLANAGAGSSFDATDPTVTPFGPIPSQVETVDGGLQISQDGGSTGFIPPITEPETYAMLLAALGVVGFVARHRRGTAAR